MKLYLVWKTRHHIVHPTKQLVSAYLDQAKAESELEELEKNNTDAVVEDHYGPLSGTSYSLQEWETQD